MLDSPFQSFQGQAVESTCSCVLTTPTRWEQALQGAPCSRDAFAVHAVVLLAVAFWLRSSSAKLTIEQPKQPDLRAINHEMTTQETRLYRNYCIFRLTYSRSHRPAKLRRKQVTNLAELHNHRQALPARLLYHNLLFNASPLIKLAKSSCWVFL